MCPEVSVTVAAAERPDPPAAPSGGGGGLTSALGGLALGRPSTSSISMAGVSGGSLVAAAGSAVVSALPAAQASGAPPRHGSAAGSAAGAAICPRRPDEDVELPLIKVVVLGAAGVGKTALVKVRKRTSLSPFLRNYFFPF